MQLTRRGRLTVTLSVTVVLLAGITAYVLTRTSVGIALGVPVAPPPCTITVGDETRDWSREQAMTATTVAGVGVRIGATVNGVAAAVETVLALTCTVASLGLGGGPPREDPGPRGLTARAETMRLAMREVFGKQTLGGFEPKGVASGHIEGSAHYEGRAIDVFFRPVTAANQARGWAQATWAVAHAERLAVATVIFDRSVWSAHRSVSGWRDYHYPGGATENPILLHEDHVHVDVVEGG